MVKFDQFKAILLIATIILAPIGGKNILIFLQIFIIILFFYIRPSIHIIHASYLLLIPLTFGFIHGFFLYSFHEVAKDTSHFFNPILYLLLGAITAKNLYHKDFFFALTFVGAFFSFSLILFMINNFGFQVFKDPRIEREAAFITAYYIISISTIVLLFYKHLYKCNLFHRNGLYVLALCINLIGLYLSASRTNTLILLIGIFIILYTKYHYKKNILLFYSFIILAAFAIILTFNKRSSFIDAIKKAPEEISIQPASNKIEINERYRGHEAYMTMRTIRRGSPEEKIFGQGFGATVDLGVESPLELRHIPIMHNGYPYIMLKTGWLGLFTYVLFGFLLLFLALKREKIDVGGHFRSYMGILAMICLISLYISNISITGLFNAETVILWVILGAALQYKLSFNGCIHSHSKL